MPTTCAADEGRAPSAGADAGDEAGDAAGAGAVSAARGEPAAPFERAKMIGPVLAGSGRTFLIFDRIGDEAGM